MCNNRRADCIDQFQQVSVLYRKRRDMKLFQRGPGFKEARSMNGVRPEQAMVLVLFLCAVFQVPGHAQSQVSSATKFEISYPRTVHSGPITGRVVLVLAP